MPEVLLGVVNVGEGVLMGKQGSSVRWVGLAVALVVLLTLAPAAGAVRSSAAPTLTGDAAGLRLVREVNRSYASVPGVRIEVAGGGFTGRFTSVMRNGVVVAQQVLVEAGAPEPTRLVRREHQGTFLHDPSRDCWRFMPKTDRQALTDIGKPMLSGPGRVSGPQIAATTATLTITSQGHAMRVVIDKRTMHVRRYEATGYLARFTNLSKRPALPTTQPHC